MRERLACLEEALPGRYHQPLSLHPAGSRPRRQFLSFQKDPPPLRREGENDRRLRPRCLFSGEPFASRILIAIPGSPLWGRLPGDELLCQCGVGCRAGMDISSWQNPFFLAFFPASGYFNENILVFIWEVAMEAFNSKMVRRIVGVSLRQIQYWDEQGFIRPSVKLAEGRGTQRLYSFSDLVQLKVVKDLTDYGLSLQKIRRCLHYLKRYFHETVQPLNSLKYLTDGEKLFVLTSDRNKILDVMDRQFVFSLGIGNLVCELDGEVRRIAGKGLPGVARNEGKRTASA